jgi:hypothetical protein
MLEFDHQSALDDEKCLVRIRMKMLMIWLGHHADPHGVVADIG